MAADWIFKRRRQRRSGKVQTDSAMRCLQVCDQSKALRITVKLCKFWPQITRNRSRQAVSIPFFIVVCEDPIFSAFEPLSDRDLALVSEWWVAEIVRQPS